MAKAESPCITGRGLNHLRLDCKRSQDYHNSGSLLGLPIDQSDAQCPP